MADLQTFTEGAKGLARNPLGIIALFIVLIYGFAALTLGINTTLEPAERLPLVWFLVLFPVVVLFTFGWLVSKHHEKLYAPGDYKTDESFLQGLHARARHAAELQTQQDELKAKVTQTLVAADAESTKTDVKALVARISSEIDRATTITVDARTFLRNQSALYTYPIATFGSLNDLTNEVYFKLKPTVKSFEYGHSWVLRNGPTGEVVRNARMITGTGPGKPLRDLRALSEAGIKAGATLVVERPADDS